jgi:hypothetical protein
MSLCRVGCVHLLAATVAVCCDGGCGVFRPWALALAVAHLSNQFRRSTAHRPAEWHQRASIPYEQSRGPAAIPVIGVVGRLSSNCSRLCSRASSDGTRSIEGDCSDERIQDHVHRRQEP